MAVVRALLIAIVLLSIAVSAAVVRVEAVDVSDESFSTPPPLPDDNYWPPPVPPEPPVPPP